jgi:nitrite reductase/ring-hydroxylating ferredoxin subunit
MYIKLCGKNELPAGALKAFKVKGHEILAVNLKDNIFCLDARCTHAGAPLSEATLNGNVLTCPWHYSQFNITNGGVLRGPAEKPLKTYHIEEKDQFVYIDL